MTPCLLRDQGLQPGTSTCRARRTLKSDTAFDDARRENMVVKASCSDICATDVLRSRFQAQTLEAKLALPPASHGATT
jgi:hypothetical protein